MSMKPLVNVFGAALATAKTLAQAITPAVVPAEPFTVFVQAEVQDIRWTDDGTTAPTAAVGFVLAVGDTLVIQSGQANTFKMIAKTAGALANIGIYKP